MRKTILLWVDALSDRWISSELTPFLFDWSKSCFSAKISPMFAYMGIEYCFEFGVPMNELGVWNDHVFSGFSGAMSSNHSLFKSVVRFVDRCSINDDSNKALRYGLFKLWRIGYGVPHLIPSCLLDTFPVPENSFNRDSLFDILRLNGVRYIRKVPKLNRSESSLVRSIPGVLKNYDFVLFKLNSLDRLGHRDGPLSGVVKQRVRYLDRLIEDLTGKLDKDVALIVMSDHGMAPVYGTYDLIGLLKDRGYAFSRDYLAFVGATYASFWFKTEKMRRAIEKDLRKLEFGKLLTLDDYSKLGINDLATKYGEDIFVIDENRVLFPEFYHRRKPPAGMHGYAFSKYDSPVFLLHDNSINASNNGNINFIDIMPTILALFNLPIPSDVKGHSVL